MLLRPITFVRQSGLPIATQIYLSLRTSLLNGEIPVGVRLPSTRDLATQLGVSRTGIVSAFERLVAEGYLTSRVGDGTRVSEIQIDKTAPAVENVAPARLSKMAQQVIQTSPRGIMPLLPFRPGTPALELAPLELWGRAMRMACLEAKPDALDVSDSLGLPKLRQLIAERLYRTRSIVCEGEQVAIVSSSQQAFYLIARLFLEQGDEVWLEDPGYFGARRALFAAGANIVPVPVDKDGLDVVRGMQRAPNAKLAYVAPSHQFPTGYTMSLERRLALLAWAQSSDALIVEDDYDSEFVFEGPPLAALYSLSKHARVMYIGTFSKTLFPAARLAYVVLPKNLVEPFRCIRRVTDGFTPTLLQHAAARFLAEGHLDRHIRHVRAAYAERRDALMDAAKLHFNGLANLVVVPTGLDAVAWLPPHVSDRAVASAAHKQGVETFSLSQFAMEPIAQGGLVLGFSAFSADRIHLAASQLAKVLATF
ncbi:PLP-dependent aminotransferase family protein [Pseudolysobacter antarcticus]|uniref:PLP-dependent aminotransferase family protein n=1 Tax=Pseudolysobacter antarcticus TaxID=2511995 RepID=A0A411HI74_9GAMM|nr:PLP-dependent aminotransferase family protein [Pseudolysobacter antarcticus]QBB70114.1 PLP-dependent aminotransferase family protein [Pseudolysobacter antarcticus]